MDGTKSVRQQVEDQHGRQAEVRDQLQNFKRGAGGELISRGPEQVEISQQPSGVYQKSFSDKDNLCALPIFYPSGEEKDHYHQYEDEVCLKCDNADLLRHERLSGNMKNVQTEGCDFSEFNKTEYRPRLPQPPAQHRLPEPPHLTQICYPGYPRVSVHDYARQGYYDDTIPYYPPPRPYPPRYSQPRRHLPPPPRLAGGYRYFRPPQRPPQPMRGSVVGDESVVTMRYPDYLPVRRPLSEVTTRQWGQLRGLDQTSLPRRRLPVIPQQRRLPDTLPRTGKMSYQYDTEIQLTNQTELGNSIKNKDDAYTRNTQDKSKNAEHKTTSKQPHKDNSHNQGLLCSVHPQIIFYYSKQRHRL